MKVTLKFHHDRFTKELVLSTGQSVMAGRSSKCDVKVDDARASSFHCRLNLKENSLEIVDLNSKNGTYLNGIRVDQAEVFIGDKIKFGKTILTFEETECDTEALDALAFPGQVKERMGYALKADFTGARNLNQANDNSLAIQKLGMMDPRQKEIAIRRQIKSQIKLSKQEIRAKHKGVSVAALLIDITSLIAIFPLTYFSINLLSPESLPEDQKVIMTYVFQACVALTFLTFNFKVSRFTFGEKLSGLEKLYIDQ